MDAAKTMNAFCDAFYEKSSKNGKHFRQTPEVVSKIIAELAKEYEIQTMINPNGEFGEDCVNLMINVAKELKNSPSMVSFEDDTIATMMTNMSFTKFDAENGIDVLEAGSKHKAICANIFDNLEFKQMFDLCISSVPNSSKLKQHTPIEYIKRAMNVSKHGIFIFPSYYIDGKTYLEEQKYLLNFVHLDKIINVGKTVLFKRVEASTSIIVCSHLGFSKQSDTTIVHLENLDKYYKRKLYSQDYIFKNKTDEDFVLNKVAHESAIQIDPLKEFDWSKKPDMFSKVKTGMTTYKGSKEDVDILKFYTKNHIINRFKFDIQNSDFTEARKLVEIYESRLYILDGIKEQQLKKMKFTDVFKIVIGSETVSTPQKPRWTFVREYLVNNHGNLKSSTGFTLKPLINLDWFNIYIIGTQIVNSDFNRFNDVSSKFLKSLEVYVYSP